MKITHPYSQSRKNARPVCIFRQFAIIKVQFISHQNKNVPFLLLSAMNKRKKDKNASGQDALVRTTPILMLIPIIVQIQKDFFFFAFFCFFLSCYARVPLGRFISPGGHSAVPADGRVLRLS